MFKGMTHLSSRHRASLQCNSEQRQGVCVHITCSPATGAYAASNTRMVPSQSTVPAVDCEGAWVHSPDHACTMLRLTPHTTSQSQVISRRGIFMVMPPPPWGAGRWQSTCWLGAAPGLHPTQVQTIVAVSSQVSKMSRQQRHRRDTLQPTAARTCFGRGDLGAVSEQPESHWMPDGCAHGHPRWHLSIVDCWTI